MMARSSTELAIVVLSAQYSLSPILPRRGCRHVRRSSQVSPTESWYPGNPCRDEHGQVHCRRVLRFPADGSGSAGRRTPGVAGGRRSAAPGFMSGDQLPALAACHRLAPGCRAVVTADGDPADWSVPTCHGRTWQELSEAPCYRAMFRIDRRFGSSPYRWRASIRNWEPDTRRELIRRRLRGQG